MVSYAKITSSQDTPYYFNFGTGESSWQRSWQRSWQLTEVMADRLSDEPVSFNAIEARTREFTALRGEHRDLKYQPTRFTGCNPAIEIDKYLREMGKEPYNKKIIELNLSKCRVNNMALLTHFPNLTSLNISGNGISPMEVQVISDPRSGLTSLDISGNGISSEEAQAITDSLRRLTRLTHLDIGGNDIGDDGAKAICGLINLISLNICENWIGPNGIQDISNMTKLTHLDISDNTIGDDGVKAISKIKGLIYLDIVENNIGPEGAKAISDPVHGLKNLMHLNIKYNQIGEEGAKAISKMKKLTSLDIDPEAI